MTVDSERDKAINFLSEWLLKPHDAHLQSYIQRAILEGFKAWVPAEQLALQFLCNGERKFLLTVKGDVKAFDSAAQLVDYVGRCQEQKKIQEAQQAKKAS
jgi:hypothetical protein